MILKCESVKKTNGDFPGSPVAQTLHFQWRGHGFDPWSRKEHPTCCMTQPKDEREKKKIFFKTNEQMNAWMDEWMNEWIN